FAFNGCSGLTGSLTLPNTVTTIGDAAFQSCSGFTGSLMLPNSVTTINGFAFNGCSGLTGSLTLPNSVTTIGNSAFADCNGLTGSLTLPNTVTTISNYAFNGCSGLTGSLTLPNTVTTIGSGTFYGCSGFTGSLTIPTSVTTIGEYAFGSCSGFTGALTIPTSVTSIGNYAFRNCTGLTDIYTEAINPPSIAAETFLNVPITAVHVPCGSESAYQSAAYWSSFTITSDFFTVSVQANDDAMGTANILQANTCTDNTAIIEATANPGYRFVQWNDGNTDNPRTVTVTQDITYTAEFEAEQYAVSVESNDATMGVVSGSGSYAYNSTATISATANTGYRFVQWNDGNTDNPRTVTVTSDISYTAEFEAEQYAVSVESGDITMGTVSGSGSYAYNSTATISATANTGYRFVQWNDGNTDNPRTVIVTSDITYTAEFEVAGTAATSGATGDCVWTITGTSGDYTLTISGTGAMGSYNNGSDVPWYSYSSDIKTLAIEEGVTNVGKSAFQNCGSLTSVTISESVTSIEDFAFQACGSLTSITIPSGVRSIGYRTFAFCYNLTSVTNLNSTPQDINDLFVFLDVDLSKATLYVPAGSVEAYKAAEVWKNFGIIGTYDDENVQVDPAVHSVTITWPAVQEATGYLIIIYSDANRTQEVTRLELDINGQLILRSDTPLSYTLMGLLAGTQYYYTLTSYDSEDEVLTAYAGEFNSLPTGIDNLVIGSAIRIYPNPVAERFRIDGIGGSTQIIITDVHGQTVLQQTVKSDESVFVGHLPKGIYLVRANGKTFKIVKN
ncbi:MAG: leucine-rich repeat protein, partial [Dysgonamonadaceae bacterium]|nr:leucine-rich repeat protein [Dysgonamonadaceae bacterium]